MIGGFNRVGFKPVCVYVCTIESSSRRGKKEGKEERRNETKKEEKKIRKDCDNQLFRPTWKHWMLRYRSRAEVSRANLSRKSYIEADAASSRGGTRWKQLKTHRKS